MCVYVCSCDLGEKYVTFLFTVSFVEKEKHPILSLVL